GLFILGFVSLPILAADCFILTRQGFPVTQHLSGLAFRHLPFLAWVLLPPLALGSLTRNLGQVILLILLIILRLIALMPFSGNIPDGSTNIGWIDNVTGTFMLALVLAAVVLIEYRSRRTWFAGTIAATFVVFPGFSVPLKWQLELQSRVK